jgi:site-specific DNA-methyltransferase (adenine-specific)
MIEIVEQDNLEFLQKCGSQFDLIYIDPPFNTGKTQRLHENSYQDKYADFISFMEPRLIEAHRLLKPSGTIYVHLDYREAYKIRVLLDRVFGYDCFLNEIIWAYDYGARQKRKWPTKHDTILVYVKDPDNYYFDIDACDRIPYMAPGLVGPEKAARGKTPTDVWWHTIVPTNGSERVGYPTQKPLGILRRIVSVSSPQGGNVLDFFAGSGTTGAACQELERNCVLGDSNPQAIAVMKRRLNYGSL